MRSTAVCRGFALVELLAVVVVLALLASMLAVSADESRRLARLGEDIAKLRQIGAWTGSYGGDHSDQFWTFSWKKGQSLSQYPDLNNATSDLQAAANQAVDILRRVAGREDIPVIGGWFPHTMYSQLPLVEYTRGPMPEATFVSSADRHRLRWARDPHGFDQGLYLPAPPGVPGDPQTKRWPYSASFQLWTSFYDISPVGNRVSAAGGHNQYIVPAGVNLAARTLADAASPADKVHVNDAAAWHFGPRVSHSVFEEMRVPTLHVDGAVRIRASGDANPGWQPNVPSAASPTTYIYSPGPWEAPTLIGSSSQQVIAGRFRWTRGFLAGRDFNGPEVCTGQPGCP